MNRRNRKLYEKNKDLGCTKMNVKFRTSLGGKFKPSEQIDIQISIDLLSNMGGTWLGSVGENSKQENK